MNMGGCQLVGDISLKLMIEEARDIKYKWKIKNIYMCIYISLKIIHVLSISK